MGDGVSKNGTLDPSGCYLDGKRDSSRHIGRSNESNDDDDFVLKVSGRVNKIATPPSSQATELCVASTISKPISVCSHEDATAGPKSLTRNVCDTLVVVEPVTECSSSFPSAAALAPSQATGLVVAEPALASRIRLGSLKRPRPRINGQMWGTFAKKRYVNISVGYLDGIRDSSRHVSRSNALNAIDDLVLKDSGCLNNASTAIPAQTTGLVCATPAVTEPILVCSQSLHEDVAAGPKPSARTVCDTLAVAEPVTGCSSSFHTAAVTARSKATGLVVTEPSSSRIRFGILKRYRSRSNEHVWGVLSKKRFVHISGGYLEDKSDSSRHVGCSNASNAADDLVLKLTRRLNKVATTELVCATPAVTKPILVCSQLLCEEAAAAPKPSTRTVSETLVVADPMTDCSSSFSTAAVPAPCQGTGLAVIETALSSRSPSGSLKRYLPRINGRLWGVLTKKRFVNVSSGDLDGKRDSSCRVGHANVSKAADDLAVTLNRHLRNVETTLPSQTAEIARATPEVAQSISVRPLSLLEDAAAGPNPLTRNVCDTLAVAEPVIDCSSSFRTAAALALSQATGLVVAEPALPSQIPSGRLTLCRSRIKEQLWGILAKKQYVNISSVYLDGRRDSSRHVGCSNTSKPADGLVATIDRHMDKVATTLPSQPTELIHGTPIVAKQISVCSQSLHGDAAAGPKPSTRTVCDTLVVAEPVTDCSSSFCTAAVVPPSQGNGLVGSQPALPSETQSGGGKRCRSSINEQLRDVLTRNRFMDALVGVASPNKKRSRGHLAHGQQEQSFMICAHSDDAKDGQQKDRNPFGIATSLGADEHTAARLHVCHAEANNSPDKKSKQSISYEQSEGNQQSESIIGTPRQQEWEMPLTYHRPDEVSSQQVGEGSPCKLRRKQHVDGGIVGEVQEQKGHPAWKHSDHLPDGSNSDFGSAGPKVHEEEACGQGSHHSNGATSSEKSEKPDCNGRNAHAHSDDRQRKRKTKKAPAPPGLKGAAARLRRGVIVRLHDLQTCPELNGALGLCLGPAHESDSSIKRGARWIVHFESDEVPYCSGEEQTASAGVFRTVRRENLQVVGCGGAPRRDAKDPERGKRGAPSQDQVVHGIAALECAALERCSPSERESLKRKLLLKWHPDKAPSSANQAIATKVMQTMLSLPQWQG